MDLVGLAADFYKAPFKGWRAQELQVQNLRGSILPRSRHKLALHALEGGFTHLFFIDSDMRFPVNILRRLLSWDTFIVACNCSTKEYPGSPTARIFNPHSPESGFPYYIFPDSSGLRKVWRIGTGVMLIKTDVFRRVPKPWFGTKWVESDEDFVGEDWFFCERAQEAGFDIMVDVAASKYIGHVGDFTYDWTTVKMKEEYLLPPIRERMIEGRVLDAAEVRILAEGYLRKHPGAEGFREATEASGGDCTERGASNGQEASA
jgi:hypothetical protein